MKIKEGSPLGKILLCTAGVAGSMFINEMFDWFVFPVVISWFGYEGLIKSFLILYLSALFLNYILIKVYDVFKKDLFGFEEIKTMKNTIGVHTQKKTFRERVLFRIKKYPKLTFIVLSIYDPFLATLYKRDTATFTGFTWKDYGTLLVSTFIGCICWTILCSPSLLINLQGLVHKVI